MYWDIAIKNMKNNLRDYIIYFFTVALTISLFYAFNVTDTYTYLVKFIGVEEGYQIQQINMLVDGISIFVAIVLGIVIIYANTFFIKRRKKEVGVCLSLGMSQNKISFTMFLESILIGVVALFVGLIIGVIISQFMTAGVLRISKVLSTGYSFIFSGWALLKTIIAFIIIFVIVGIYNISMVSNSNISELVKEERKLSDEKEFEKSNKKGIIFTAIGVVLIAIAYIVLAFNLESLFGGTTLLLLMPIVGFVGTIFFFCGIVKVITGVSIKNEAFYYKDANIFAISQLRGKFGKSSTTMILVSCLMVIAMICVSLGIMENKLNISNGSKMSPVGATITMTDSVKLASIDNAMQKGILKNYDYGILQLNKTSGEFYVGNNKTDTVTNNAYILNESQFNKFLEMEGKKPIDIKGHEAVVLSDTKQILNQIGREQEGQYVKFGNVKYDVKDVESMHIQDTNANYNNLTIILPDNQFKVNNSVLDTLKVDQPTPNINPKITFYQNVDGKMTELNNYRDNFTMTLVNLNPKSVKYNTETSYKEVYKDVREYMPKVITPIDAVVPMVNQIDSVYAVQSQTAVNNIETICGPIYVGAVFLIIAAALVALSQLIDINDDKDRYKTLRKLGADDKMINKVLIYQIVIKFIIPFAFAAINAIIIMTIFNTTMPLEGVGSMSAFLAIIIVGLIYLIYIILTYINAKKLLRD